MRTTLAIDDDVLVAAKASRNKIPLLPVKPEAPPVTLDIVNALRDGCDIASYPSTPHTT